MVRQVQVQVIFSTAYLFDAGMALVLTTCFRWDWTAGLLRVWQTTLLPCWIITAFLREYEVIQS